MSHLTVRRARIEDHDDLAPLFNSQTELLSSIYGEFYLADLISKQDVHQQMLVAEVGGRSVGLMGLTDMVDINLLQVCFDLAPYENCDKRVPDEEQVEEDKTPPPPVRIGCIFHTLVERTKPPPPTAADAAAQSQHASQPTSSPPSHREMKQEGGGVSTDEEVTFPTEYWISTLQEYDAELQQAEGEGVPDRDSLLQLSRDLLPKLSTLLLTDAGSVLNFDIFEKILVTLIEQLDNYSVKEILSYIEQVFQVKLPAPEEEEEAEKPTIQAGTAKDNVFCITLFCLDECLCFLHGHNQTHVVLSCIISHVPLAHMCVSVFSLRISQSGHSEIRLCRVSRQRLLLADSASHRS